MVWGFKGANPFVKIKFFIIFYPSFLFLVGKVFIGVLHKNHMMSLFILFDILEKGVQNRYVIALILFIVFLSFAKLLLFLSKTRLLKLTKRTKTRIDDLIVKKTNKLFSWVIILFGFKISVAYLKMQTVYAKSVIDLIDILIILLLTIIFIIIGDILIFNWGHRFSKKTKSGVHDEIVPLLQALNRIFFIIVSGLIIMKIWNLKIIGVLTSLGLAGVVIGFALRDSLSNMAGGVSLILDQTFSVGDFIKLESGEMGEVIKVGLRSTRIKTLDNELMIIPNGPLSMSKITNYAKPNNALRVIIEVGVVYGSNIDKVKKVLLDSITDISGILKKPAPEVWFDKMADFSLNFKLLFYIRNYRKRFTIKSKATSLVFKSLKKNNIEIAFPTRTVYMKKA
ncbi:mechanosensitive ion channel family protein [Candidatus Woesearchaeota archaeon]|nr:MAG: mechanosensitive ion channel family protein [Candidatus Woesearchaeota archaeon]